MPLAVVSERLNSYSSQSDERARGSSAMQKTMVRLLVIGSSLAALVLAGGASRLWR